MSGDFPREKSVLQKEKNVIAEDYINLRENFLHALAEVTQWGEIYIDELHTKSNHGWKLAHSYNVGLTAYFLAKQHFHYSEQDALHFLKIGIMHDLGFSYIKEAGSILNKEGELDHKEFAEQKKHVELSLSLAGIPKTQEYDYLKQVIRGHHQFQYDSYPEKTMEEELMDQEKNSKLYVDRKILALADQAEALTAYGFSKRPYRKSPINAENAIKFMRHSRQGIETHFFTIDEAMDAIDAARQVFAHEEFYLQGII